MTSTWQAITGAAMIVIGGIKTWFHMGTIPLLSLPTCSGDTINVALRHAGWFERAHCWGCYMLAAGLIVVGLAAFDVFAKRRSVAS